MQPIKSHFFFQVTENPDHVWSSEYDDPSRLPADKSVGDLYTVLVRHVKRVVTERDKFAHRVVEISLASPAGKDDGEESAAAAGGGGSAAGSGGGSLSQEKNHLALEVAESKAKIRKLNQAL